MKHGRLDYASFFAFAEATAPALTHWVAAENHPPLRACFDALSDYNGAEAAAILSSLNVPELCWAGEDDIYYAPLKAWSAANHLPFASTGGDHVSAIVDLAPAMAHSVYQFLQSSSST